MNLSDQAPGVVQQSSNAYVITSLISDPFQLSTALRDRRPGHLARNTVMASLSELHRRGAVGREKVREGFHGRPTYRYFIDDLDQLPDGMRETYTFQDRRAGVSPRGRGTYKGVERVVQEELFPRSAPHPGFHQPEEALRAREPVDWAAVDRARATDQVFQDLCDEQVVDVRPLSFVYAPDTQETLSTLSRVDIVSDQPTVVLFVDGASVSFTLSKAREVHRQLALVFSQ